MSVWLIGNDTDAPYYQAHRNFITGSDRSACRYVFQVPPEQRCDFVRETDDCHDMVQAVDYMTLLFCTLSGAGTYIGIVVMIIVSVFLVFVLIVNAQMNFAPTLLVIAKSMYMSEYLAGVTLLPLANGLVDLVIGFEKYDGDTELWSNEAMGTAMFVTGFIGGWILLLHPFTVVPIFFILQNVFYLVTVTWITTIMINETVLLWEAIGCVFVYGMFLGSIVFLHVKQKNQRNPSVDRISVAFLRHIEPIKLKNRVTFNVNSKEIDTTDWIFREYWLFLDPTTATVWSESNRFERIFFVCAFVPRVLLAILVPSVNYDRPMNGWCKLAIIVNMFFVPPIFLLAARVTMRTQYFIGLVLSTAAAVLILITTRFDCRPRFHDMFAVLGLAISITIVYFAASELMSCLNTLFTLLNVGRQTIGLAAVAWGNGLADLVVNVQVAHCGHHIMASAACYGGPILNLLIGYGIKFVMRSATGGANMSKARSGTMGFTSVIFMFCFINITMLWTMLSNFQSRRTIGIGMLCIYGMYLVFCLLCELNVMHGYGTDHYNESPFQV